MSQKSEKPYSLHMKEEVRILNASAGLIENYVNCRVCCFPEDREKIINTVLPQNGIAKEYFYILLLEMISPVNIEMIENKNNGDSLVTLLKTITVSPKLGSVSDIVRLSSAVNKLISWLDYEFEYPIYSNNLGREIKVKFKNEEIIYLIGNRYKHSIVRLNKVRNKMVAIYKKSGVELNIEEELLILGDIETWLFDDFGGYCFTKPCELSSEIYHGIMEYIKPIKETRIRYPEPSDKIFYEYTIPVEPTEKESKFEFYELLNRTRNIWMPRIKTWESLDHNNPSEARGD